MADCDDTYTAAWRVQPQKRGWKEEICAGTTYITALEEAAELRKSGEVVRAPILRRIERQEDRASPSRAPGPHVLVFVNPDGAECPRMCIRHALQRTSPQICKARGSSTR